MNSYDLNSYVNECGTWNCQIIFDPPIGNTGEAQRILSNAIANAKRRIRGELLARSNGLLTRLSYHVSANRVLGTNHLLSLTITEGK